MSLIGRRKQATFVEEITGEDGPPPAAPLMRGAVCAVLHNPYAGRYEPDILPMMEALKPLGLAMANALIDAPGGDPGRIACAGTMAERAADDDARGAYLTA